jgi:hypothetical protein
MKSAFLATALGTLFTVITLAYAEVTLPQLEKEVQAGAEKVKERTSETTDDSSDFTRYKYLYRLEQESNRRVLALGVMATGIFSLFLVLMYLQGRKATAVTMIHGSGLVLVIFGTVLVVVLAKVDEQLSAATGILGAMAGYLFGKTTGSDNGGSDQNQDPKTKKPE